MGNCIRVRVLNWAKHKGRKDVNHARWFALSNRLLEDPDFFDFSASEILAWIYILSQCSQKGSDTVDINFSHADRVCRIKKSEMISAISKLQGKQLVPVDVTPTLRACDAADTSACATEQNRTEHNTTTQETHSAAPAFGPEELQKIWNDFRGSLSEVKVLSDTRKKHARARIRELPDPKEWESIVKRIAESDFCNARSPNPGSAWVASFDWLLQPDSYIKVQEGKYDNRKAVVEHRDEVKSILDKQMRQRLGGASGY